MKKQITVGLLLGVLVGAGPATRPAERAEGLRRNAGNLVFRLVYEGPADKPYYSAAFGRKVSLYEMMPSKREEISAEQAEGVVDVLEREGMLGRPVEEGRMRILSCAHPPQAYVLYVDGGAESYAMVLGWDLTMVRRLERVRGELDGKAGEAMQKVLDRLAGEKGKWEEEEKKK